MVVTPLYIHQYKLVLIDDVNSWHWGARHANCQIILWCQLWAKNRKLRVNKVRIYLHNSAGSFLKSKNFMPQFSWSVTKSVLTDLSSFHRPSFSVRSCDTESRRLLMDVMRELRRSIGTWTILRHQQLRRPLCPQRWCGASSWEALWIRTIVLVLWGFNGWSSLEIGRRHCILPWCEWLRRKSRLIALTRKHFTRKWT